MKRQARIPLKKAIEAGLIPTPSLHAMMLLENLRRSGKADVYVLPKDICGMRNSHAYLVVETAGDVQIDEKALGADILVVDGVWSFTSSEYSDKFVQQWIRFGERKCGSSFRSASMIAPIVEVSILPGQNNIMTWFFRRGPGSPSGSHIDSLRRFTWYTKPHEFLGEAIGQLHFYGRWYMFSAPYEIKWGSVGAKADEWFRALRPQRLDIEKAVREAVDIAREVGWKPRGWQP